jgi:hypothetical protein
MSLAQIRHLGQERLRFASTAWTRGRQASVLRTAVSGSSTSSSQIEALARGIEQP